MSWKRLGDINVSGQRVVTRVDINVPVDNGAVTDATRIERIVPTVNAIRDASGMVVLLAHFGRPKGKPVPDMSLKVVLGSLSAALGTQVDFAEDCVGDAAIAATRALGPGDVILMENTRFHAGEEQNDPEFAAALAKLGDIYCNDAFSACHRAHASTEGLARHLPACAGLLLQEELEALEHALGNPSRPVVAVVGGAKVSTKLDLLGNLIAKADTIVIGGGMANTFLAAQGVDVGKSLCEHDLTETATKIMKDAQDQGCQLLLPSDVVVAREFKAGADNETVAATACPADAMILDAGPEAVEAIRTAFEASKTLVWNGPLGAFEIAPFDMATNAAAGIAADLTRSGRLLSVAGGGDTVAALNGANAAEAFTYVSTAGGAFLEWLEGKTLPGVAVLDQG